MLDWFAARAAPSLAADRTSARMDLSTVIVHYHSLDTLPRCLRALAAATSGLEAETVVLDNDSRDGVEGLLAREFPGVRVVTNPDNRGFARAVNQGIAATRGEFVLVVNPDCFLEPGAVAAMAAYARAHPRAGVVGPQLRDGNGAIEFSARAFPDAASFLFNRYSLLTRLFPRNPFSRRYLLTDWDHATTRDVDWLSGACLLVRRAAIAAVGPMDEGFFMFNEDVDWCRRMKHGGWLVTYLPEARGTHVVGASRKRVAARVILERHRGMIRYFHKHHPTHPVVAAFADTLILVRAGVMMTANALRPR
jgi:N-acetylglucosaminyl-diphospho-decaprenol L-rhamnosyltransferase